jgi:hypothetical protein
MKKEEPKLIDPNITIKTVMSLKKGYIIVGGENEQIYGTLNFKTIFIWTSLEKANDFIKKNLNFKEDKVIEKPIKDLFGLARNLTYDNVRFDFQAKGAHPKQAFLNYRLHGEGILDILSNFFSN